MSENMKPYLSKFRRDLLRKNKHRIMALAIIQGEEEVPKNDECLYQYDTGHICAASACLKDSERENILNHDKNSWNITSVVRYNHAFFEHDEELKTISNLQSFHDEFLLDPNEKSEIFFVNYLNDLLEEE